MVVIVAALRAMQAAGTLKDANIEVHLTGDEEDAGDPIAVSRADLIAAGKRSDVALDFEGLVRDGPGKKGGADMRSEERRVGKERVQYVEIAGVGVSIKKKKINEKKT